MQSVERKLETAASSAQSSRRRTSLEEYARDAREKSCLLKLVETNKDDADERARKIADSVSVVAWPGGSADRMNEPDRARAHFAGPSRELRVEQVSIGASRRAVR